MSSYNYESARVDDADIVVVAFGAASRVARTAVRDARAKGIKCGLLRPITLWPFPTKAIDQVIESGATKFLSVELNMGQMVQDVRLAVNGRASVDFFGRTGGVLPTPEEVLAAIEALASGNAIEQSAKPGAVGSLLPHQRHRKSSYERGE